MSWIDAIEDFFEEMNPPEIMKCKIVRYKMEGAAYYWWKQLQRERNKHGKEEIISWPRMRGFLISRFAPGYCSTKCPAEVYKGSQAIDDSSSADNCKVSKCRDDSLDSLGHDVTIDNKETQVGKANEETEKDLELETSKKDVVNNVDCLLIPTQEIPFMLSIAKGSEFGGTTVKLACPVLRIPHDPLNDVWTYQLSLRNPFLQGCWWSTSVSAESTRGSLRTKQHTVEFLLLPAVLNAYYDVDVFLFDPGGNIHLSSSVGTKNYFLSCSSRLNSNGFFNLLENEVMLMLLKRFSNEKDKEMVAPITSEKPNTSSTPACIFVIDNGISASAASGIVFYVHEADGILIRKIQKLIRTNVDSQVNGFTYHINDLGFVKETYTITWGLFGHRTNKPLVLMSASSVLQPQNIERGKLPYRLTGHTDLMYSVDFIPYDNVNEILIEACWTREVHFTLLYHLPVVSILITLSFDPGGSPCSLETWGILAFLVYADSFVLNVTIDTKCDERRELGGVTSNIILVYGFLTNELEYDLCNDTVYSILIAGLTYEGLNLGHDNLSSFVLTRVGIIGVLPCGNLNILVFDETDHVVAEHGLQPLNVGIISHILILFDPGGIACFLITWMSEFCGPALIELETKYGKKYLMPDEEKRNVAFTDLVSKEEYACWEAPIVSNIEMLGRQFAEVHVSLVVHGEKVAGSLKPEIDEYHCSKIIIVQSSWHLKCFRKELLQRSLIRHAYEGQNATTKDVKGMNMSRGGLAKDDHVDMVTIFLSLLDLCPYHISVALFLYYDNMIPHHLIAINWESIWEPNEFVKYVLIVSLRSFTISNLVAGKVCYDFFESLRLEIMEEVLLFNEPWDYTFHITRGRVISWEGWHDKNNSTTSVMAKHSVVTIILCLSILVKNGHVKRTLKLFYRVVNGLDPPKALMASSGVLMCSACHRQWTRSWTSFLCGRMEMMQ